MEVASEEIASSSSSLMVVEALDRGSLEANLVNKRIASDKKLMAAREGRRNGENAVKTERLPSVLLNTEVEAPFGRLPPEISRLPLVVLNVSNNSFSGPIPTELGDAHCLQNLDLSINNFSGELPASLNGLTDLTKFNVSFNPLLYGVVPVTGQIATFDNDSFLGDPNISISLLCEPRSREEKEKITGDSLGGEELVEELAEMNWAALTKTSGRVGGEVIEAKSSRQYSRSRQRVEVSVKWRNLSKRELAAPRKPLTVE